MSHTKAEGKREKSSVHYHDHVTGHSSSCDLVRPSCDHYVSLFTYLCPISCAMVKAVLRPLSLFTLQLFPFLQALPKSAIPGGREGGREGGGKIGKKWKVKIEFQIPLIPKSSLFLDPLPRALQQLLPASQMLSLVRRTATSC